MSTQTNDKPTATEAREWANQITSAETATNMCNRHGKAAITAHLMLQFIGDIRSNQPELAEYLNHPEIVMGLAVGRFGRKGLLRRLNEMSEADSAE